MTSLFANHIGRTSAARIFLAILCLLAVAGAGARGEAAEPEDSASRPRIGLVLSGGGARGTAHIGVLKVLEDLRVPIDAIAGTSMGAVVGGLYASGLTAREIESVMTSLNWQDAFSDRPPRADTAYRRKLEDRNFLVDFPLGLRSGRFLLPKGLIQGQKLNQALRRVTLPVARISNFDELPIKFRAVATDLETGEPVVIGAGDLTSAMRASVSAPGVFAPVEREGRLLVDGGIAENLPIDVAREMGVDILIVVDVGFPLVARERLNSAPVISNQMLAILIRRNAEHQRATLSANDIIIDPALGEASSFDFNIVERAISEGEKAAMLWKERLAALAVDEQTHARYAQRREAVRSGEPPRIDFVRVEAGSERYSKQLNSLFDEEIGKPLDPETISRQVTRLYGQGNLEALDYRLVEEDKRYGLSLIARRNSWGPNYIRFGLNLQDDFEGNSSYNAATRFVLSEITAPGGEWVWDLQVGETSLLSTEVYLPLPNSPRYFFQPHAQIGARNVSMLDGQEPIAEYRVRTTQYGVDFGREFGNLGEIRAGIQKERGHTRVRVGDPLLPVQRFDAQQFFMRLSFDSLDDLNFPHSGQSMSLEWRTDDERLADRANSERVEFDYLVARSFGRHTAVFWTTAGSTLDGPDDDVRSLFSLGGFFNLSGLKPDSVSGPHFGVARFLFYRQIGRGGPGFLDVPAYLGFSLEAGNVWERRQDASFGSARKDMSAFLGLDTLIGPVYLATGFEEGGSQAFYLFLGRTF